EKNVCVVHMGTDELWRWWDARSRSQVSAIQTIKDDHLCFRVDCKYASGMIVKIALPNFGGAKILCDTQPTSYESRNEFGRDWAYLIVPMGKHTDIIVEAE
ncbi:MAG: hypothetical protein KAW89_00595, partial [Armatimonadetes bacterium]|nr:hypothetical protein [Armatimonadota bacterium]